MLSNSLCVGCPYQTKNASQSRPWGSVSLQFLDIRHAYDDQRVLEGVSLDAERGDITCLLGPSGCGKTTLLRLAAGLLPIQAGEIRLGKEVLAAPRAALAPEKRPVGLVFQEGALFPHLNVTANVAFGIQKDADRASKVSRLLEQVGLQDQAKAFPHELSGGQKQRVALARALAPKPAVLLLDEPFASVDIVLRRQLRDETRALLKDQDAVAVMVTHDPEEALEIADKIAVMAQGRIVQAGSPAQLFDHPSTAEVALMFGDAQPVLATRDGDGLKTPFGVWPLAAMQEAVPTDTSLQLIVRPDALALEPGGEMRLQDLRPHDRERCKATITNKAGAAITAIVPRSGLVDPTQGLRVVPKPGSVMAFSAP